MEWPGGNENEDEKGNENENGNEKFEYSMQPKG